MANSTTNLDTISSSQASKEVTANALFDAASPGTLYGRRATTTTALTWGFYGGMLDIAGTLTAISNATVALTASNTNYVVAARATGVVTASTTTTNWNNTVDYIKLYSVVAGASTITSYTDYRTTLQTSTITTHIADATDAHAASAITNTPAGSISATTVQAAINELDSEKSPLAGSASITTVGALNSGSITSGFGAIDIGTDSLTAGSVSVVGGADVQTSVTIAESGTRSLVLKNPTSTLDAVVETGTNHPMTIAGTTTVNVKIGSVGSRSLIGTFSSTGLAVNGVVSVGGATPAASGAGITFPAAQSASTDANTLDDYEEGTWPIAITFGGAAVGVTYSSQSGTYTKVGNAVTVTYELILSAKGSSTGAVRITGLPFPSKSGITQCIPQPFATGIVTATSVGALITTADTTIQLQNAITNYSSALQDTNVSSTTRFSGSFTYLV